MTSDFYQLIPFIFLYAELHYRFKWLGSLYYQKEPEILADTPNRIEPGLPIPILILIKDAHKFPIHLDYISVVIYQYGQRLFSNDISFNQKINNRWWDETIFIETNNLNGNLQLIVKIYYSVNGLKKHCNTHNFPQSSTQELNTYISRYHYPRDKQVQYGDLHYHTNLTEDMVEFGAPLKASLIAAQSMGLDFYCTTDHSYDLDDKVDSWTETDPDLVKWNNSRKEIKTINNEDVFSSFIIPSEELTLHNHKGRNIHALILNNSKFLSGSGDGAEKYFNFKCQFNTNDIHNCLENTSVCIAAHPFETPSFLQRILFKRGSWDKKDILHDKLAGLQILNGEIGPEYYNGIRKWITLLLNGFKKFIYAGNDAHGNFNIYRQIKIPMLKLSEENKQIFGKFRTGVYPLKKFDIKSVIESLKEGNCFVTNGPLLNFSCESSKINYTMGDSIKEQKGTLKVHALSTPEFGFIKNISIIKGVIGEIEEEECFNIVKPHTHELRHLHEVNADRSCYYRCEVSIDSKEEVIFALSNPIWFYP